MAARPRVIGSRKKRARRTKASTSASSRAITEPAPLLVLDFNARTVAVMASLPVAWALSCHSVLAASGRRLAADADPADAGQLDSRFGEIDADIEAKEIELDPLVAGHQQPGETEKRNLIARRARRWREHVEAGQK